MAGLRAISAAGDHEPVRRSWTLLRLSYHNQNGETPQYLGNSVDDFEKAMRVYGMTNF